MSAPPSVFSLGPVLPHPGFLSDHPAPWWSHSTLGLSLPILQPPPKPEQVWYNCNRAELCLVDLKSYQKKLAHLVFISFWVAVCDSLVEVGDLLQHGVEHPIKRRVVAHRCVLIGWRLDRRHVQFHRRFAHTGGYKKSKLSTAYRLKYCDATLLATSPLLTMVELCEELSWWPVSHQRVQQV